MRRKTDKIKAPVMNRGLLAGNTAHVPSLLVEDLGSTAARCCQDFHGNSETRKSQPQKEGRSTNYERRI